LLTLRAITRTHVDTRRRGRDQPFFQVHRYRYLPYLPPFDHGPNAEWRCGAQLAVVHIGRSGAGARTCAKPSAATVLSAGTAWKIKRSSLCGSMEYACDNGHATSAMALTLSIYWYICNHRYSHRGCQVSSPYVQLRSTPPARAAQQSFGPPPSRPAEGPLALLAGGL
jgi:hypothetical protein